MAVTDASGVVDCTAALPTSPEFHHPRSSFEPPPGIDLSAIRAIDTALLVASGELPGVTLDNPQAANANAQAPHTEETSWLDGAVNVGSDLLEGGWDELTGHPLRVICNAAIGAAATVAAGLLAPEVALVVGAGVALYGAYELISNVPGWVHDATVVANPEDYSAQEQKLAHADLRNVGAGTVDLAAGVAGGIGASMLMTPKVIPPTKGTAAATQDHAITQAAASSDDVFLLPVPIISGVAAQTATN